MAAAELFVCTTCFKDHAVNDPENLPGGERLARLVASQVTSKDQIKVIPTECLFACKQACNIHLRAPGKIGYIAGRFEPELADAEAIVEYTRHYIQSDTGQVPYRNWPQGIKGHFIARIPPLSN